MKTIFNGDTMTERMLVSMVKFEFEYWVKRTTLTCFVNLYLGQGTIAKNKTKKLCLGMVNTIEKFTFKNLNVCKTPEVLQNFEFENRIESIQNHLLEFWDNQEHCDASNIVVRFFCYRFFHNMYGGFECHLVGRKRADYYGEKASTSKQIILVGTLWTFQTIKTPKKVQSGTFIEQTGEKGSN